jgi:hypothetical protein
MGDRHSRVTSATGGDSMSTEAESRSALLGKRRGEGGGHGVTGGDEHQREHDAAVETDSAGDARRDEPGHRKQDWRQCAEHPDSEAGNRYVQADVAENRRDRSHCPAQAECHEHDAQQCGRAPCPQRRGAGL